ncbi:HAD-IA family hydrolase [Poseidonocella sp. HB161398]|uniref:HAD-IA family hydrolase n=1 Tax=Poseidonocella sp. HB161398 TaxID=2320855 RepID=UPI0019825B33|nr:HAD-IA family hydrolase [Poseidonocella sp. HB161398]
MLRALIFDVDGTLAETEEAHRRAFNETFAAEGIPWHWSRADYARLLKVTGGKERMRAHRDALGAGPPDGAIARLHALKTARYGALLAAGGIALRPGVAEILALAPAAGLRLAIATTTSRPNVDALVFACLGRAAEEVFEVIAAGDEVPGKKPAPDVYLAALARLGLPAQAALAFEDSRNGLLSARAAGLEVVVTPSAYTAEEDFTGAAAILPDLRHWRLPAPLGG